MADVAVQGEPAPQEYQPHGWRRFVYAANHKDVGRLYLWFAVLAGIAGGILSMAMRAEMLEPGLQIFKNPHSYAVFATGHGLIMIFFMVLPALIGGFGNWLVPLMIGAPDTAFPRLNTVSFWLMPVAFGFLVLSMFVEGDGGAAGAGGGWSLYAPLTASGSFGPAMDFIILALYIAAASSILSAINFITTILNMRCPGMTLHKLPVFVWSILVAAFLILLSMPVLAATVTMLIADRHFGTAFFDPAGGGDPLLYQQLFWFFANPAAYALILPAFGIVTQIIAALAKRPVFGGLAIAYAMIVLGFLGFMGWADHLYTAGLAPATKAFFVFATLAAAVPLTVITGALIATLWGGVIRLSTPMLFALGFIVLFVLGGLSGLVMGANAVLRGSLFVTGHLHLVLAASAVFAIFAGWYFWFPKFTGYLYNEALSKLQFWLSFIGVILAFVPMLFLGLSGMARRAADYPDVYAGWNGVSSVGAFMAGAAVAVFLAAAVEAFIRKREAGDNPWNVIEPTLEWTLSSPPPFHSFNELPKIT